MLGTTRSRTCSSREDASIRVAFTGATSGDG